MRVSRPWSRAHCVARVSPVCPESRSRASARKACARQGNCQIASMRKMLHNFCFSRLNTTTSSLTRHFLIKCSVLLVFVTLFDWIRNIAVMCKILRKGAKKRTTLNPSGITFDDGQEKQKPPSAAALAAAAANLGSFPLALLEDEIGPTWLTFVSLGVVGVVAAAHETNLEVGSVGCWRLARVNCTESSKVKLFSVLYITHLVNLLLKIIEWALMLLVNKWLTTYERGYFKAELWLGAAALKDRCIVQFGLRKN